MPISIPEDSYFTSSQIISWHDTGMCVGVLEQSGLLPVVVDIPLHRLSYSVAISSSIFEGIKSVRFWMMYD